MAFVKKTWLQRIVDFPGRRKLSPTEIPNTYDVTRDEGNIIQAGDALTAVNLNDLENRIEAAINERIEKIMIVQNAISTNPETVASGPALKAVNDKLTETNNNFVQSTGSFVYNTGFSLANYTSIVKMGKVVTLLIGVKKTDDTAFASATNHIIGIISEGFRPKASQLCIAGFDTAQWGVSKIGYGFIGSDGQVTIKVADGTCKTAIIQISYLTA